MKKGHVLLPTTATSAEKIFEMNFENTKRSPYDFFRQCETKIISTKVTFSKVFENHKFYVEHQRVYYDFFETKIYTKKNSQRLFFTGNFLGKPKYFRKIKGSPFQVYWVKWHETEQSEKWYWQLYWAINFEAVSFQSETDLCYPSVPETENVKPDTFVWRFFL